MEARDDVEEQILIAAFQKRQRIEVMKTRALITAAINPDKAYDAFMAYMGMALPEYAIMREEADKKLLRTIHGETGKVFVLEGAGEGYSATEIKTDA